MIHFAQYDKRLFFQKKMQAELNKHLKATALIMYLMRRSLSYPKIMQAELNKHLKATALIMYL
ncbi:MAG: hypothetical protein Q4F97_05065, partial [Bacteroidales bacterium]|nr:hypothetical protein [Bacteroidales bacterium]